MDALRKAAEQEQEPVAWMVYTLDGKSVCVTDNPSDFGEQHRALPLYAHPPRRQHAEITALRAEVERLREALEYAVRQNEHDMLLTGDECRAARAALKETK